MTTLDLQPRLYPVYVWDLLVRATHWLIALSIIFLSVTGLYIGNPFIAVPGVAGDHFVMGTMKAIHFYSAIVFTLAVLSRLVWMFIGPPQARWNRFLPVSKERLRGIAGVLRFYLFWSRRPPSYRGHNPLEGLTYTVVFLLYLLQIATGFGLWSMRAYASSLRGFAVLLVPFGGAQSALWIHHVVMWLLLGFAVHHIASAVLMSRVERSGVVESIFSGFKFLPWRQNTGGEDEP